MVILNIEECKIEEPFTLVPQICFCLSPAALVDNHSSALAIVRQSKRVTNKSDVPEEIKKFKENQEKFKHDGHVKAKAEHVPP